MLLYIALIAGAVVCGLQAVRAPKLMTSALWLAGVSALLSIVFYQMGAPQIAVIELSLGAGLITVLVVFAVSVAGEETSGLISIVPEPLAGFLVAVCALLIGLQVLPFGAEQGVAAGAAAGVPFREMLWQVRSLDMLVQVVLIFAGIVGVLGLIGQTQHAPISDDVEADEEAISDVVTREYSPVGSPGSNGGRAVRAADYAQPD